MIKSYQSAAGEMGIFYVENCSRLTVTVLKITIYVYKIVILFYLDKNLFLFRL